MATESDNTNGNVSGITNATPSVDVTPTTFFNILKEFAGNLSKRFPANTGARTAYSSLELFQSIPDSHVDIVHKWYGFTAPISHHIRDKEGKIVGEAFDTCEISIIRDIGAKEILANEQIDSETKESVWKYIQSLTNLSKVLKERGDITVKPNETTDPISPNNMSPAQTTPVNQVPAGNPNANKQNKPPDPSQIVSGITEAFPKILQSLNDVLKDDKGDNPLAQMLKTVMNPDQLQTGMTGNIAANLMQGNDKSVMSENPPLFEASQRSGLSADDIMYRLQRLENMEKARAKRRGQRRHRPNKDA